MSRIYILDYDMDARPLRFVYRDDFRHQSLYPDDLEKLFSKLEVHIPAPFRQGDILWDPSGSRASPTRRTARPLCWTTFPTGMKRSRQPTGLPLGRSSTSEKGTGEV